MALERQGITTREDILVPNAPEVEKEPTAERRAAAWGRWTRDLISSLRQSFRVHQHIFPATISGEMRVREYTVATKPAAGTAGKGAIIFVSDGGAGAVFQGSTGAAWVNLG